MIYTSLLPRVGGLFGGNGWMPPALVKGLFLSLSFSAIALQAEEEERAMTARDVTPEILATLTVPDPDRELPFVPGERLTFLIGWSFFDVGQAVLSLDETEFEGEPALLFTLEVQTNSFADRFYRVRNRTRTWMDADATTTLHYHNEQSEGGRERNIEYDFDWEAKTVRYRNRDNEEDPNFRDPIDVLFGTFDPMGVTFLVRSLPFDVGDRLVVPTTNGRELFITEIDVTGRVDRNFRLGRQRALVLRPEIEDVGGIFRRSSDASVTFYMSDDERRLPLRMESSVAVGSFWAELIRVERPGEELEEMETSPRTRRRGRGR